MVFQTFVDDTSSLVNCYLEGTGEKGKVNMGLEGAPETSLSSGTHILKASGWLRSDK
jgi:hypothetical protein